MASERPEVARHNRFLGKLYMRFTLRGIGVAAAGRRGFVRRYTDGGPSWGVPDRRKQKSARRARRLNRR